MRRDFTTFDQIADAFDFGSSTPDEIIEKLRRRRSELHPDRTGGQFTTRNQEEQFHLVDQALSAAENLKSVTTALVPVEAITQIVRAIREAGVPGVRESREQLLDTRLTGHIERYLDAFRSPLAPPAVVSGAISAVLTALWFFPGVASEHPVLKQYIFPDSPIFAAVWLSLVTITATLWMMSWRTKARHERIQRLLRTEAYQNALFEEFLRMHSPKVFTKNDLSLHIRTYPSFYQPHPYPRWLSWLRDSSFLPSRPSIDPETAQIVVDLILLRLEQRGVIAQVPGKTVSPKYRVEDLTE